MGAAFFVAMTVGRLKTIGLGAGVWDDIIGLDNAPIFRNFAR
jgi:hypothetical protein